MASAAGLRKRVKKVVQEDRRGVTDVVGTRTQERIDRAEEEKKKRTTGLREAARKGIPVAKLPGDVNRTKAAEAVVKKEVDVIQAAAQLREQHPEWFAAPPPGAADTGKTGDGRDYSKPWKRHPNQGAYTGAPRAPYPKVFRPYGSNTRQRVVGDRSHITHMHHLGYAKGIVESKPVPPLLPSHAPLGQSGAPSVLHGVAALRPGPAHLLFTYR